MVVQQNGNRTGSEEPQCGVPGACRCSCPAFAFTSCQNEFHLGPFGSSLRASASGDAVAGLYAACTRSMARISDGVAGTGVNAGGGTGDAGTEDDAGCSTAVR